LLFGYRFDKVYNHHLSFSHLAHGTAIGTAAGRRPSERRASTQLEANSAKYKFFIFRDPLACDPLGRNIQNRHILRTFENTLGILGAGF
jgi:hypothetical protein